MKSSRVPVLAAIVLGLAACLGAGVNSSPTPMTSGSDATMAIPATPTETAVPTATPDNILPVAGLNLSGRLIFSRNPRDIQQIDMATGIMSPVFEPPHNGYLVSSAVSPDRSQIAISYQPPIPNGSSKGVPIYGYTHIYLLPIDGSAEPKLYLKGNSDSDILAVPFWSPDGKYLYFTHYHADEDSYNLERVAYPDDKPETVVRRVLYARLSPDGTKLAYLKLDSNNFQYTLNLSDADGKNETELVSSTRFFTMDVVAFSPDGESVVFSAVGGSTLYTKPDSPVVLTDWFGTGVALDGNLPADLWQIYIESRRLRQMTYLGEMSLSPAFSPDGKHMAVIGVGGIYVGDTTGTNLTRLTRYGAVSTADWIP